MQKSDKTLKDAFRDFVDNGDFDNRLLQSRERVDAGLAPLKLRITLTGEWRVIKDDEPLPPDAIDIAIPPDSGDGDGYDEWLQMETALRGLGASIAGSQGGRASTDRKATASRKNGRLGGRPEKQKGDR